MELVISFAPYSFPVPFISVLLLFLSPSLPRYPLRYESFSLNITGPLTITDVYCILHAFYTRILQDCLHVLVSVFPAS
jgi:hypothetical protein